MAYDIVTIAERALTELASVMEDYSKEGWIVRAAYYADGRHVAILQRTPKEYTRGKTDQQGRSPRRKASPANSAGE